MNLKPKSEKRFLNDEIKMFIIRNMFLISGTFEDIQSATEDVLAVVCEAQEEVLMSQ
ncbi:hypothetical protein ACT7DA_12385 [Bacillus pacificus]